MQTEEQPEFRFNWRVMVIVLVTMTALIIPLVGIALAIKGVLSHHPAEVDAPKVESLEKALDDVAAKQMAIPRLDANPRISLKAANPEAEGERVQKLAKACGGAILPVSLSNEGGRILLQVDSAFVAPLTVALQSQQEVLGSEPPPSGEKTLIEVEISKKKP